MDFLRSELLLWGAVADLLHLQSDRPAAPCGAFLKSADLQRDDLLAVRGNTGVDAARNISIGLRVWPKRELSDFAFGEARFAAISERHPTMAADDAFRPRNRSIILRGR